MSVVTVLPGDDVTLDPSDSRVIMFDFDVLNLPVGVTLTNAATSYGLTITALKQGGLTALTMDNQALLAGSRKVQARFIATTATRGDKYRVSCKGTTNESPSQDKEYSIFVSIENK